MNSFTSHDDLKEIKNFFKSDPKLIKDNEFKIITGKLNSMLNEDAFEPDNHVPFLTYASTLIQKVFRKYILSLILSAIIVS